MRTNGSSRTFRRTSADADERLSELSLLREVRNALFFVPSDVPDRLDAVSARSVRTDPSMKVIDPGHVYELNFLDGEPATTWAEHGPSFQENWLIFVKREGPKYPGNIGHHPGTQLQEVLRALIDRVKYVEQQEHHAANDAVLYRLRDCIFFLELRAAARHGRELRIENNLFRIEHLPTCDKCGHIGCEGKCH